MGQVNDFGVSEGKVSKRKHMTWSLIGFQPILGERADGETRPKSRNRMGCNTTVGIAAPSNIAYIGKFQMHPKLPWLGSSPS